MPNDLLTRFRIKPGDRANLGKRDAADASAFADHKAAEQQSSKDGAAINELQDKLYAEGKRALLVIGGADRQRHRCLAVAEGADRLRILEAEEAILERLKIDQLLEQLPRFDEGLALEAAVLAAQRGRLGDRHRRHGRRLLAPGRP